MPLEKKKKKEEVGESVTDCLEVCVWHIVVVACAQLDEKVREWQESSVTASKCYWVTEQASWASLITSAATFLSDGILGELYVLYIYIRSKPGEWTVAQWYC